MYSGGRSSRSSCILVEVVGEVVLEVVVVLVAVLLVVGGVRRSLGVAVLYWAAAVWKGVKLLGWSEGGHLEHVLLSSIL